MESLSITIVVVSRLVYRKGVDLLVGIIPSICHAIDTVDFLVGGDGSKMLDLQEMVERERLQERVEFLGSIPHVKVRDVLVRGHVFLNCSLTESFCIAILEAASCGLLVVSTNVGGVPEVLPDDMIMLAEPNVASMVEKIRLAVECQPREKDVAWETHERIKQMYSWERVATETAKVYETVQEQERRSFLERMSCYQSLGGISGFVVCSFVLIAQLWLLFIEWWQPRNPIDIVPDLTPLSKPNEKTKAI
jgi:phosphatidylinositol glycan class A protein